MNKTNLFIIDLEKIKRDTKINHPLCSLLTFDFSLHFALFGKLKLEEKNL